MADAMVSACDDASGWDRSGPCDAQKKDTAGVAFVAAIHVGLWDSH